MRFALTDQPIDVVAETARLADQRAGALATFEGWVRDHNDGRRVAGLEYEAFAPLAEAEARRVLDEATSRFAIHAVHAVHRVGDLALGDRAVWVGAIASHRDEAFRACRYVIDEIKARLPIWKKERYLDGAPVWVNCQRCASLAHDHDHEDGATIEEAALYARQIRLPSIGEEGQARLKAARVLIVGLGGLGSAAAPSLAAAGVGTIGLVEDDTLDASNLHRQLLYSAADIGRPKAHLAAERLRALNPFVAVRVHSDRLGTANCADIITGYDLVLDCSDNFATKYLLNDAAFLLGVPVIQASLYQFEGQLLVLDRDGRGGCLRCIHPAAPPAGAVGSCAEVGVLGVVPQIFGALQANEALKRLLGMAGQLGDATLLFDVASLETQRLQRARRADCALCGDTPTIVALAATDDAGIDEIEIDLERIDPATLGDVHWIDLREAHERDAADRLAAQHVPFATFDADAPGFPPDRRSFLFCASGQRSLRAARALRGRGWNRVWSIRGGAASLAALARGDAA